MSLLDALGVVADLTTIAAAIGLCIHLDRRRERDRDRHRQ